MYKSIGILFVFFALNLASCSSDKKINNQAHIKLLQDTVVSHSDKEAILSKKGKTVAVHGPLLLESPGYVSVLVVPTEFNQALEVGLKPLSESTIHPHTQIDQNIKLSRILFKINQAQGLLQKRKVSDALAIVDGLIQENPSLIYLNFLKASCHYMLGQKELSRSSLDQALKIHSDFKEALDLYDHLLLPGERNPYRGSQK